MEKIPPRERWILHFTHLDNLPAIRAKGALVCDVAARQGLNREEVGDPEIKDIRRRRAVPVGPGGTVGGSAPTATPPPRPPCSPPTSTGSTRWSTGR